MLASLLSSHRKQLDALAAAWLAAGATGFALCQDGVPFASWPASYVADAPDLSAPLHAAAGDTLGELRVTGLTGAAAHTRLASDAALLAALAEANGELDGMAAALAETEDQLLALYELAAAGASRLDSAQLARSLARQAQRLLKAEGAFVVLAPGQVVQMPAPTAADDALIGLFERLRAEGRELLLDARELPFSHGSRAAVLFLAPLLTRQETELVACLGLWFDRLAATLSPDLKLARSIAEQGGAQLEIALLHQELVAQARVQAELELARQVQLSLLPRRPPRITGVELYAESRPALEVGGDFYDFYGTTTATRQNTQLTFAVGDVSGKGMSAALLMAITRTALREVSGGVDGPQTPAAILGRATADLYDDFTEVGMMATVFVGQYDAPRRVLTFANAGHSPVVFCPQGGLARLLEADGPVMGALPISLSEDQALHFGPGDLLVVLTDGFNEARDLSGEFLGTERLMRQIENAAARPVQEIAEELYAGVGRFAGNQPQEDDQTILVVKGV